MSDKTFVDTNILVCARDAAFPEKNRIASILIEELWKDRSGRISVQVMSEFFVTVTQRLKPGMKAETAWEDIDALMAWDPLPLDRGTLTKAREGQLRYGLAWWDALIVAAAYQGGCGKIVSEDFSDGQTYFGIRAINPFREK